MVHVGAVDAPVTLADVKAIAAEVWKAVGSGKNAPHKAGVDILGWEFAFELNELAKQVAADARVDVTFKKIPREVLEKRAVEQGDIKFFELAALSVKVSFSREPWVQAFGPVRSILPASAMTTTQSRVLGPFRLFRCSPHLHARRRGHSQTSPTL